MVSSRSPAVISRAYFLVLLTSCNGADPDWDEWSVTQTGSVALHIDQCERYYQAAVQCIEQAGGDTSGYVNQSECDSYPPELTDYYGCLADAYEANDCSTIEGIVAAGATAANCTP